MVWFSQNMNELITIENKTKEADSFSYNII